MSKIVSFLNDESGASAAEYVLIIAVMGVALAAGATYLGNSLNTAMHDIGDYLTGKSGALS
jgi:pilus assembly protein Flp/PilA